MDWGDVYYTYLLFHQNGIQSIDTSSKLDLSVFTTLNNVKLDAISKQSQVY